MSDTRDNASPALNAHNHDEATPSMLVAAALAVTSVWAYLSAVLLLNERILSFTFGPAVWYASIGVIAVLLFRSFQLVVRKAILGSSALKNLSLISVSAVFSVVLLDTTYALYLNAAPPGEDLRVARNYDQNLLVAEFYPKVYYPTSKNFRIYKPSVWVAGSHFGSRYAPSMQQSETLMTEVLERVTLKVDINEHGFRDTTSISDARIVALGDSYTFGWGVAEESAWPGLLESLTDKPVYNAGIHDASPKQEVDLLEHMLRKHEEFRSIEHVLWMIYEGNDLEDSYSPKRPPAKKPRSGNISRGTILGFAASLPKTIKTQSVIWKLSSGQISRRNTGGDKSPNPYSIDSVELSHPLYHSDSLGPRLFHKPYIDLAKEPQEYVRKHPNRAHLEATIDEMRNLAEEFGFEVTVLLAPTAARLHGRFFEGFPEVTKRPFFLDHVAEKSASVGFRVLNLYDLMEPHAGSSLLYFRDDDHFNVRGNEVVAELVQRELWSVEH